MGIFAFSVFQPVSAQTTSSTDVTRSFSASRGWRADGTVSVDVTITLNNVGSLVRSDVTETLHDGIGLTNQSNPDKVNGTCRVGDEAVIRHDSGADDLIHCTPISAPHMAVHRQRLPRVPLVLQTFSRHVCGQWHHSQYRDRRRPPR